jgi:hypothetical protein
MQAKESITGLKRDKSPLIWGLIFGILFGVLLQKGGATKYDVIIGQLWQHDFAATLQCQ